MQDFAEVSGRLISLYEAKNGREALEIFSREAPQVAVLDIEMPGLTGLEVARKIRETDKIAPSCS